MKSREREREKKGKMGELNKRKNKEIFSFVLELLKSRLRNSKKKIKKTLQKPLFEQEQTNNDKF